ncbi:MAG TPA: hypothetical protein VK689_05955, partial [Armatimonadota bacterium]|nr:hypothetical protein [Armatimonadota bacterium]
DVQVAPAEPPATLAELLGAAPAWETLVDALAAGWQEAIGATLRRDALEGQEVRGAEGHRARFEDPAWTWHR